MPPSNKVASSITFISKDWRDVIEAESCTKEQLFELLKAQSLEGKFLQKEYNNGKYLYVQSVELGISFQFDLNILTCVFIYGPSNKQFQPFDSTLLPSVLSSQWTTKFKEIVALLGEPTAKSGGGVTQISISYDRLGMEFTFSSKLWADQVAVLDFITLYKRESNSANCGFCKTPCLQLCARCNIVNYCSAECQKKHFAMHKNACIAFASKD